jgi:hypothetical protein
MEASSVETDIDREPADDAVSDIAVVTASASPSAG